MPESELHEKTLRDFFKELKENGYRVIDLERKCPDGLALKDGKIYALEVLGTQWKKGKGQHRKWTYNGKEQIYHMFDGVLFKTFEYEKTKSLIRGKIN